MSALHARQRSPTVCTSWRVPSGRAGRGPHHIPVARAAPKSPDARTDTCQRTVPRARAVHLTSDSLTLMTTETHEEALRQYIQAELPTTVAELCRLVRIPSVSWPAFDPAHVSASADAVAELLRGIGLFDLVEVRQAALDNS